MVGFGYAWWRGGDVGGGCASGGLPLGGWHALRRRGGGGIVCTTVGAAVG